MVILAECRGIKKIAMPWIGCGLDRLNWLLVRQVIIHAFATTDIEVMICDWKGKR